MIGFSGAIERGEVQDQSSPLLTIVSGTSRCAAPNDVNIRFKTNLGTPDQQTRTMVCEDCRRSTSRQREIHR